MPDPDTDPDTGPRGPRFRRKTPDARRQALLEAAMACIARDGIEGTSVRTICRAAGVSTGLVNHYYASKDALIADVYRRVAGDLLDAMAERAARAEAPRARLSGFLDAAFSPVSFDPGLFRIWLAFWTGTFASPEIAGVHRETYAAYRAAVERLLAPLADATPAQMRLPAIGLSALLDGLWLEWGLNPETFSPAEGRALAEGWVEGWLATRAGGDVSQGAT